VDSGQGLWPLSGAEGAQSAGPLNLKSEIERPCSVPTRRVQRRSTQDVLEETSALRNQATTRCRPLKRAYPNPFFPPTHGFHRGLRDAARRGGLKSPGSPSRAYPWGLGVSENTFEKPATAGEIN